MYHKLLLGLMLSAIFAVTVQAQSSSRGSGAKPTSGSASRATTNASAAKIRMEREADQAYLKAAKQVAKSEFAPIHLSRPQLLTLKEAVAANYQTMSGIEKNISQYIPKNKRNELKKVYNKAIKAGKNEMEAMSVSMQAIGISEASQQKVMELSKTKMTVMATVKSAVIPTLTAEQNAALAASMADKKMTDDKMADKEMTGKDMKETSMSEEKMTEKTMTDKDRCLKRRCRKRK